MSRSTPSLLRAQAAAFDFDVVTDVPARPPRNAQPEPAPARTDADATAAPRKDVAEAR